jgi:hypothetical protein
MVRSARGGLIRNARAGRLAALIRAASTPRLCYNLLGRFTGRVSHGRASQHNLGAQGPYYHTIMSLHRASMVLMLAAGALAGCSKDKQTAAIDPNALPTNYRSTLVAFLRQSLTNRADFRGAMISEPALKPVGPSQHYVVCLQFNPRSQIKTKAAVFLSGQMSQFIDATSDQCADAAYQPFKELEAASP